MKKAAFFIYPLLIIFTSIIMSVDVIAQQTIVAFGDSITAPRKGVVTYSDLLRNEFARKKTEIKVINSGVPGNTTVNGKERFEKDVLAHKPNLVIIQFGTNDAAVDVWKTPPATEPRVAIDVYEQNLRGFITTLKSQGAKVILVTPPPMRWTEKMKGMYGRPPYNPEDPDGFNIILKDYVKVIRRIAAKEKVKLVDLFSEFYKYHKAPGQKMEDLFLDGSHPNSAGHQIEANLLLREIRKMKLGF
jgi:lysophospholipase L1-like esterase